MKTTILWIIMAGVACADTKVSDPITTEALVLKQQNGSLENLPQVDEDTPPVPLPNTQSIIAQSEILHDGTNWTLVPRGAVLFVPERKTANVGARPIGTLLPWSDFLAKNPAWISTHETTYSQASGDEPIAAEKTEAWAKHEQVIIAVHQGGPISVNR